MMLLKLRDVMEQRFCYRGVFLFLQNCFTAEAEIYQISRSRFLDISNLVSSFSQ